MALSEIKELAEVKVLNKSGTVDVRWDTTIFRDEEVISTIPHRKSYSVEQKEEFLAEVDQAQLYIQILNW